MTTISGRIRIHVGKSDSNEVSSKFGGYTLTGKLIPGSRPI